MCPRCAGQYVNFDGEGPTCLSCGYVPVEMPAWLTAEFEARKGEEIRPTQIRNARNRYRHKRQHGRRGMVMHAGVPL